MSEKSRVKKGNVASDKKVVKPGDSVGLHSMKSSELKKRTSLNAEVDGGLASLAKATAAGVAGSVARSSESASVGRSVSFFLFIVLVT